MPMNVIEAYIKFHGELIILISGLSGSGKTRLSKYLERDFKIKHVDIEQFCDKSFNKTVDLPNGKTVVDWDDINSYDWKTIMKEIENNKKQGIVLCAPYFTTNIMKNIDYFHIHIKIQKQDLINARKKYVENNIETCGELKDIESLIVNQLTYPHYLDYLKLSKIDKFINQKDMTLDQVYDEVFSFLIYKIQQFLDEYNEGLEKSNMHENKSNIKHKKKPTMADEDGEIPKKSSESTFTDSDKSVDSDKSTFLGTTYDINLEKQFY